MGRTTDTETADQATEAPAVTPAPTDAFTAVANLLALIVDAPACQTRIAELRAAQAAAEKAARLLARSRLEAGAEAAKQKQELEAERKSLAERERALMQREAELEILSRAPSRDARLRHFPNGMTAEPDDEPPATGPLGHFRINPPEEMVLEPMGGGTTLTRSVPKPKRSLRRVQPDGIAP